LSKFTVCSSGIEHNAVFAQAKKWDFWEKFLHVCFMFDSFFGFCFHTGKVAVCIYTRITYLIGKLIDYCVRSGSKYWTLQTG
jgi:hypothetical protein